MSLAPAPGWYPDPTPPAGSPRGLRWWDGDAWSAYVEPGVAFGGGPTTPDGEPLAEWWRRLLASLIDALIVGVPFGVFGIVVFVASVGDLRRDGTQDGAAVVPWFWNSVWIWFGFGVLVLAAVLYEALFLRFRGATPGKMVLGIRVRLLERPGQLPWGTIALRMFVKSGVPTVLGRVPLAGTGLGTLFQLLDGLWPLWDDRRQALHDKAARTVVVRAR